MNLAVEMLTLVSPIFLTIAIGQIVSRVGVVSQSFWTDAGKFFYWVGMPLLIFHKVALSDLDTALDPMQLFGATCGYCVLFAVAWTLSALMGMPPGKRGSFLQASLRGNMSYIGLSVVLSVYGEDGIAAASVLFGWLVGLLNVLSLLAILLPMGKADAHGPRFWAVQLGGSPFVIAAAAGVLWSLVGFTIPTVLDGTLEIVGRMTLPLALLTIGAEFRLTDLGGDGTAIALASVLKLLAAPFLVGVFCWIFGVRGLLLDVAVVLAAAPTSGAGYLLAQALGADRELARTTVLFCTVGAIVGFTAVLTTLKLLAI